MYSVFLFTFLVYHVMQHHLLHPVNLVTILVRRRLLHSCLPFRTSLPKAVHNRPTEEIYTINLSWFDPRATVHHFGL